MYNDTIAAVSSGFCEAGISVIRISGPDAFHIADLIFSATSGKKIEDIRSFSVSYGHIIFEGETYDEVLLIKMAAPHTYTREDIIEIDCHGGILVTKRVLELIYKCGARPAEPGEFTKRAFLNGRIDLSQAEAVCDIIGSKSELALKNSLKHLKGNVKNNISGLREIILKKTAFIEAALDDPEHISLEGFSETLRDDIAKVMKEIEKLIVSFENGRLIKEGINTVILGRPNAGKSSLLNLFMGEERAIVTAVPGTTRDTLEETISLDGIILNLTDTAGIRDTKDEVEKIGVERAARAAEDADLILYVIDASCQLHEDDLRLFELLKNHKSIILLNKSDIENVIDTDSISELCPARIIVFSAEQSIGFEELKRTIKEMFFSGEININDEIFITSLRQKENLSKAYEALKNVMDSLDAGMPEDFLSIDLMAAYTELGLITGDNVEDDLADKIFSEFCMGK